MYTHLEDFVNNLYNIIGIYNPYNLDMYVIAHRLGIKIVYNKTSFRYGSIIALTRVSKQQCWQRFGHELSHYVGHVGHQLKMPYLFRDLQEYQANRFAYHFCVPTFMLDQLKGVTANDIVALFNVEYSFALKRLEMYKNKFIGGLNHNAMQ